MKEIISFRSPSTAFNQEFAVDVLWETTERETAYWVKT